MFNYYTSPSQKIKGSSSCFTFYSLHYICYNTFMENIKLNTQNIENIELFKTLLNKDSNTMINEALELYFDEEAEKIQAMKDSQTNLSFDEFWDDVDV